MSNQSFSSRSALADKSKALGDRGGGSGLLNPSLAVKIITPILGFQGVMSSIMTDTMLEAYTVPNTPASRLLHKLTGLTWICFAMGSFMLYIQKRPIEQVTGAIASLYAIDVLRGILTGESVAVGLSIVSQWLLVAIDGTVAYASFQTKHAATAVKFFPVWLGLNGLPMIVNPAWTLQMWGISDTVETDELIMRLLGFAFAGVTAFLGSTVFGKVSAGKAIGYGHLSSGTAAAISTLFITREADKLGMPKGPFYVWLVIYAYVLSSLLL